MAGITPAHTQPHPQQRQKVVLLLLLFEDLPHHPTLLHRQHEPLRRRLHRRRAPGRPARRRDQRRPDHGRAGGGQVPSERRLGRGRHGEREAVSVDVGGFFFSLFSLFPSLFSLFSFFFHSILWCLFREYVCKVRKEKGRGLGKYIVSLSWVCV